MIAILPVLTRRFNRVSPVSHSRTIATPVRVPEVIEDFPIFQQKLELDSTAGRKRVQLPA